MEKTAQERNLLPMRSIFRVRERMVLLSRLIVPPFRRHCSKPNSSVMKRELLPGPSDSGREGLNWPTAGPSFSTREAKSPLPYRSNFSVFFRKDSLKEWEETRPFFQMSV